MTGPSNTFVAEAVVAEAPGTGPHEQAGSERAWTPQGQVVDVFLKLFLERAYSDAGDRAHEDPFADHGDDPLIAECERLADFLATEHFEGQLIAPLRDFRIDGEALQLTEGVNIVTVEWSWLEALWAEHGWGGPSTQPLQSHDLYGYGHALSVAVGGQKLGGWDWAAASP